MKKQRRLYLPIAAALVVAMLLFGLSPTAPAARAAGSLTLPRTTVPQGATVAVSGSGFTSQDSVVVYVDAPVYGHTQRIQTATTSNGSGTFSAHLNLPRGINPGTYTLTAKDTHGVSATQRLAVLALIVLRANGPAPSVIVVDRNGFFVDALGFQSGETVKLQAQFPTYGGTTIVENRTATANGNGDVYNVRMYAPAGAKAGAATLTAVGQSSNKQAQGHVNVVYRPYVYLNHKSITAGSLVEVIGRAFASNATIRIQITIRGTGGDTQTLSVTAGTDNNGDFTKWIRLPSYTSPGTYTFTVSGDLTGLKRYATLVVTQKPSPKPTATPTPKPTPVPTYHASAQVLPAVTLPNQDVTFTGKGFPANTTVTVSVTVDMRGGGNRYISKTAVTDSNGNFTVAFRVPYRAAPGTYTVTASTSKAQASDQLQVLPLSAHPKNLGFRWISLWYHAVRQGTWDYLNIQATLNTQLGIWVHVIFPNGRHYDYFTLTDHSGHWAVKFTIPRHGASSHSNQAYVTFQLWHGKQTMQAFMDFTLV